MDNIIKKFVPLFMKEIYERNIQLQNFFSDIDILDIYVDINLQLYQVLVSFSSIEYLTFLQFEKLKNKKIIADKYDSCDMKIIVLYSQ